MTGILPYFRPFACLDYAIHYTVSSATQLDIVDKVELAGHCHGIPLAAKLSVARIASGETPRLVINWLQNAKGEVSEYCVKDQVEFAHSLSKNAFVLLLAIPFFNTRNSILRQEIGKVAELSELECDEALAILKRLSLIHLVGKNAFSVHPLVIQYCASQLEKFVDIKKRIARSWFSDIKVRSTSLEGPLEVESVKPDPSETQIGGKPIPHRVESQLVVDIDELLEKAYLVYHDRVLRSVSKALQVAPPYYDIDDISAEVWERVYRGFRNGKLEFRGEQKFLALLQSFVRYTVLDYRRRNRWYEQNVVDLDTIRHKLS